jgi:hypothetical protein
MTSIEELNIMAYGQPPRGAAIIGSIFVYKIKMNQDDTFEIHQRRQVEYIVEEFGEDTNMKKIDSPMEKGLHLPINTTTDPKLRYRALVGAFLWIAWCTRPDILFAITYLLRFSTNATKIRWDALIRVLRYLKTTVEIPFVLELTNNTSKDKYNVTIIANSDWAHDIADRKSVTKRCVIADGVLVNFITAQQATVSTSSTETEFMSTIDACREGLYFRNLLPGLITVVIPIKTSLDNIGAGYIVQNYVSNSKTKHIDVKFHMIRDWIAKKDFELFHIESNENSADIIAKVLAAPAHRGLVHRLPGDFLPIKASLDNIGAGYIVQNYVSNSRTKHIDVKFHMIRDWIAKKDFELFHIESNENSADILAKVLAAPAHRGLVHRLSGGLPLP